MAIVPPVPGLADVNTNLLNLTRTVNNLNQTVAGAFPTALTSSATWNPPNLASGSSQTTTVTVSGATLGQQTRASFSLDLSGTTLNSYVSAANTVTVVQSNLTGGAVDLASGTLKVWVYHQ